MTSDTWIERLRQGIEVQGGWNVVAPGDGGPESVNPPGARQLAKDGQPATLAPQLTARAPASLRPATGSIVWGESTIRYINMNPFPRGLPEGGLSGLMR
jgi:hypothetical protein